MFILEQNEDNALDSYRINYVKDKYESRAYFENDYKL